MEIKKETRITLTKYEMLDLLKNGYLCCDDVHLCTNEDSLLFINETGKIETGKKERKKQMEDNLKEYFKGKGFEYACSDRINEKAISP